MSYDFKTGITYALKMGKIALLISTLRHNPLYQNKPIRILEEIIIKDDLLIN